MADSVGQVLLRAENVSREVTGFALQSYKMKQLCMVSSSSSWTESYYKETSSELTGGTGHAVRGIPRLANFPYGEVTWAKTSSYLEKYGMEAHVSMEDAMTDAIDVIARTLLRIGRAVANAVDVQIEAVINADAGNSVAIAQGSGWNSATLANRDPIQNILAAQREIAIDNYDILDGSGFLVLNPTDYANLIGNSKIISNPTFKAADLIANGVVGQILGLKIIVSNVVTASQAYVVKAKEALNWKEASPLTVQTITEPGIKTTIRAWEIGVAQSPNINAMAKITNTNDAS